MKDFDTKTMNDPAIKSGHITPAMVDKICLLYTSPSPRDS